VNRNHLFAFGWVLTFAGVFAGPLGLPVNQPLALTAQTEVLRDDFNSFNTAIWVVHGDGTPDPTAASFQNGVLTLKSTGGRGWGIWTAGLHGITQPSFSVSAKVDYGSPALATAAETVEWEFYAFMFTSSPDGAVDPNGYWHEYEFGFVWLWSCSDYEVLCYTGNKWAGVRSAYVTLPFKTNRFHTYATKYYQDKIEYYVDESKVLVITNRGILAQPSYPMRIKVNRDTGYSEVPPPTETMSLLVGYTNWVGGTPSTVKYIQYEWVSISTLVPVTTSTQTTRTEATETRTTTTETRWTLPELSIGNVTTAIGVLAIGFAAFKKH